MKTTAALALLVALTACTAELAGPSPLAGKADDATNLDDPSISMTGLQKARIIDALVNSELALTTYYGDDAEAAVGEIVDGIFANSLGSPWPATYTTRLYCASAAGAMRCTVTAAMSDDAPATADEDEGEGVAYLISGDVALDETGSLVDGVVTVTNVEISYAG